MVIWPSIRGLSPVAVHAFSTPRQEQCQAAPIWKVKEIFCLVFDRLPATARVVHLLCRPCTFLPPTSKHAAAREIYGVSV